MGEKSAKSVSIVTSKGEEIKTYDTINLYAAEVENFVKHYFLKDEAAFLGTSYDDAIYGLQIIDAIRKSNLDGKAHEII
jgi:hypothetical protein